MKAALLRAPQPIERNPLEIADVPVPVPGARDVLVRVHACGVCRTDLHVTEGELPPRKSPVIPGHQVVGSVEAAGGEVTRFRRGDRVGIAWLHSTDGTCRFCLSGRENLCDDAAFTGWTVDGGYAGYALGDEQFAYPIPEGFPDLQAAPLLCAGIIGFRALRLSGIAQGGRLGIYGFGAAGHVCIQVARHWGAEVYVITRDVRHRMLASELGAGWVGGTADTPPKKLDAAIIFAPAGELVPVALRSLKKGGVLVLGGIHMTPIPQLPYELLYGERAVRTVANNTRQDGIDFLQVAAEIPIRTRVQPFRLRDANAALNALKHDAINGAAVLQVAEAESQTS
jgi:propanol-preferring alcohol dehydrogenase